MTETVQLIDTLFGNTRLFGYILNVLDIIRKMGFQYYFPHRTSHPGALHLTIKLSDEQSCPPPLAFFCKLRGTLPEFLKARTGGVPARPRDAAGGPRNNESTYRTCHRHLLPVIWPTKKGLLHQQSIASAAGPLKYVLNYILSQHLS